MKLKEVKKIINGLSDEQLNQELLYVSDKNSISGLVKKVKKAPANLYTQYEDDPSPLYTMKQLKEDGLDKDDIESCGLEIAKGAIVVYLD